MAEESIREIYFCEHCRSVLAEILVDASGQRSIYSEHRAILRTKKPAPKEGFVWIGCKQCGKDTLVNGSKFWEGITQASSTTDPASGLQKPRF